MSSMNNKLVVIANIAIALLISYAVIFKNYYVHYATITINLRYHICLAPQSLGVGFQLDTFISTALISNWLS